MNTDQPDKQPTELGALLINGETCDRIKAVMEHARRNRFPLIEIMRRMNKPGEAVGDDPNYCAEIPFGWKVIYSVEQHPCGWLEHVSFSVINKAGKRVCPPLGVVKRVLLPLLKLDGREPLKTWAEECEGGQAGNMIFDFKQ